MVRIVLLADIGNFLVSEFLFFPLLFVVVILVLALLVQVVVLLFWKKAEGTVYESKIEERHNRKNRIRYSAALFYQYSYAGVGYQGKSGWIMNELYKDKTSAQKIIDDNPQGAKVAVLVNPLIPHQSVLQKDIKPSNFIILLIGITIFGFWLVVLYMKYQIRIF